MPERSPCSGLSSCSARSHAAHRFRACPFAGAASLGADAAMLVVCGVAFALLGAGPACRLAYCQHRLDDSVVGAGPARSDGTRREAYIRAVEIKPYALDELRDHALAEARIGAGYAGLPACIAFLDALDQRVVRGALRLGMRPQHLLRGNRRLAPTLRRGLLMVRCRG